MPNTPEENPASIANINPSGAPVYFNESTGNLINPTETVQQVQEENRINSASTNESTELANKIVSGEVTVHGNYLEGSGRNYPVSVVNQAIQQANLISSRNGSQVEQAVDRVIPTIAPNIPEVIYNFPDVDEYRAPIRDIPGYTEGVLTSQAQLDRAIISNRISDYKTSDGYNLSQAFKDRAINASEAKIVGFSDQSILDSFRGQVALDKFENFKNEDGYNLKEAYNSYSDKEQFKSDAKQAGFSDIDIALTARGGFYGPTLEEAKLGPSASPTPEPVRSFEGSRGLSGKTVILTETELRNELKPIPSLIQDFKDSVASNPNKRTPEQIAKVEADNKKFAETTGAKFVMALPGAAVEVGQSLIPFLWIKDSDRLSTQDKIINSVIDATLVVGLIGKELKLTADEVKSLNLIKGADREAQLSLDRKAISSDKVNQNIKEALNRIISSEIEKPDFGYYSAAGQYIPGKLDNLKINPADIIVKKEFYDADGRFIRESTRGYNDNKGVFHSLPTVSGAAFNEQKWSQLAEQLKNGNKFDIQEIALDLAGEYSKIGSTALANRLEYIARDANEFVKLRDSGASTERNLEKIKSQLDLLDDASRNLTITSIKEPELLRQRVIEDNITRAKPTQVITKERPVSTFENYPIKQEIREIATLGRISAEPEIKDFVEEKTLDTRVDITSFPSSSSVKQENLVEIGTPLDIEQPREQVNYQRQEQENPSRQRYEIVQDLVIPGEQNQDLPENQDLGLPDDQNLPESERTTQDLGQPDIGSESGPKDKTLIEPEFKQQSRTESRLISDNQVNNKGKKIKEEEPSVSSLRSYPKFAWKQGLLWIGISYPYDENSIKYFNTQPLDYTIVKGPKGAFLSIKKVNGSGPDSDTYDEFISWFTAGKE